ncbi:MAG: helix-turn-helix transcriptional regulator [Prevotella sp.]|nr:helix-turn-helix transcriptional regulator [Prevotella sp.]
MNKQPKLMSLSRMRDLIEPHLRQVRDSIFFNNEFAIIHGDHNIFRIVRQQQPPFIINDHRLGVIIKGEIHASFNLVEKHVKAGTLVFIGPGSIINPISITDDVEIYGFGLSPDFPMPFAPGQWPAAFNGQVRDFQLPASEADIATAMQVIETLWHVVHQQDYNRALVSSLVAAQMHHYDSLFRRLADQQQGLQSREQTIFDRFIYLINQHAVEQHHMAFYASKMCLTERYLGTVVRQASGITAKEWIDRALVTRIKIELRHTNKSVAQISDEMKFPNPSFFSKYFRRLTGMTPLEFRG